MASNKKYQSSAKINTKQRIYRLLVLLISIFLMILIWTQQESLASLPKLGLIGIFLVNFVSSSTVFFPIPGVATVFLGGAIWSPILVAITSGIGSAIGESLGYLVGFGGRGVVNLPEVKNKIWRIFKQIFHRHGFITVLLTASLPFPFDIVGVLAGSLNYPMWKFMIATIIGRMVRNFIIAWTGAKILP